MGGIISGAYKVGTGIAGVMGGSPERAAAEAEHDSELSAATLGGLEARQQGAYEAGKLRTLGSQAISKQRVAYANSGVDPTSGTAASVMADTRLMSETDARMAENNAARRVRGFKEQKRQAESKYHRAVSQAEQNAAGSIMGGIGDMVGGVFGGGFGK